MPNIPGFQGLNRCMKYLDISPHKPIFYPSGSFDLSNDIRITCSGNQVEKKTTQNCLECHQDVDHTRIINRKRPVLGIVHNLLGIVVYWRVPIQPAVYSDSSDEEIICMYKHVNKAKEIINYMEELELHTG